MTLTKRKARSTDKPSTSATASSERLMTTMANSKVFQLTCRTGRHLGNSWYCGVIGGDV